MSDLIDQFVKKMSKGDEHIASIDVEIEAKNLCRFAEGGLALAQAMNRSKEAEVLTALLLRCDEEKGFIHIRREWFNAHQGDAAALFGNTEGHGPLEMKVPIRIMIWWVKRYTP